MATLSQCEARVRAWLVGLERTSNQRARVSADVLVAQGARHERFWTFAEPFLAQSLQPRLASRAGHSPNSSVDHSRAGRGVLSVRLKVDRVCGMQVSHAAPPYPGGLASTSCCLSRSDRGQFRAHPALFPSGRTPSLGI